MGGVLKFQRPKPQPTKTSSGFARVVVVALALAFAGGAGGYYLLGDVPIAEAASSVTKPLTAYGRCASAVRVRCVIDGDTLWINGVKIRVADIDTPEVSEPRCSA